MFQIPALQIEQKGVAMFVTALPLSELRRYIKVDRWGPDNDDGYQRPFVDRRLSEVAKYVNQEEGVLPTSILVCVRDNDSHQPTFEATGESEGFAQLTLTIHDDATLWVVDGQHRAYGVSRAYERDGDAGLADYPFPVTIMTGVDRYMEMTHFNIVNTRQKKMSTDIVDRHLVLQQQRMGLDMFTKGKKGEKDYQRAISTLIVDVLNDKIGPWYHQIAIPGVAGRDKGLVRQHAVVASLESIWRDPWLSSRKEEEVVELLSRYWSGSCMAGSLC